MYWARKMTSHPITLRAPVASRDAFLPTRSEEMAPNTEPGIAPIASRACIVRVREGVGGRERGWEEERGGGRKGGRGRGRER